jgi:DNA-binding CsgD family transcriptional regulator
VEAAGRALVGRSAEVSGLRAVVLAAAAGRGGAAVLLGEAGIGKTRLLDETALMAAEAGMAVLRGAAVGGGGAYRAIAEAVRELPAPVSRAEIRPYLPALGRVRPDWAVPGLPEPALDPAVVLGEGLLRVLPPGGAVLLLDDLHWADADTVALVEYLAGAVAGRPVAVIVAARDEEPETRELRRLSGRRDVTVLRPLRLPAADVLALAGQRAGGPLAEGLRAAFVDAADGLPLLAEELVDAMSGPSAGSPSVAGSSVAGPLSVALGLRGLPPTLAALVADRLDRLSASQRRVLVAAALQPGEPDAGLLAAVTGESGERTVDALRAAHPHLLTEGPDRRSRWRHALTRDAVLATVTPPERADIARRAGRLLLGRGDDAGAAELLARAGDREASAIVLLRMARRDAARGALRSSSELLDRAAAMGGSPGEIAAVRVRVHTAAGRPLDALAGGLPELPRSTGRTHADLCLALADAAVAAGRWPTAEQMCARAGRPDDPRTLGLAAEAAYGAGDLARAADLAARAVAAGAAGIADAQVDAGLDSVDAWCRALIVRGRCALRAGDARPDDWQAAARADFARAAQLAAEHGRPQLRVAALVAIATADLYDHPDSLALVEAREVALDTGQLAQVAGVDLFRVEAALTVSGPAAAAALAGEVAELAGRLGLSQVQPLAEVLFAAAPAISGDGPAMEARLAAASGRPDQPAEVAALAATVRALRALSARDLPTAAGLLDAAAATLLAHATAAPVPVWGLWAVVRTVRRDRDEEARATVRTLLAGRRATNLGGLRYAEAMAAGREAGAGRGDASAAELFAEGDRVLAGHPWWGRLLRLLTLRAAVEDGWGDPVPRLRSDLVHLDPALARICRDLLRRAGAPTRRGRGAADVPAHLRAAGVTSREMDVLILLAGGLTNAEIAARLFLSPRTVDTHVAALLAKTGARGRADLRDRLTR